MNIYELTNYVNQDVDDTFDVEDIVRWFNKGIASYNLVSPVTTYPMSILDDDGLAWNGEGLYPSHSTTPYPLDDTFMLGVMLPFIASSVRGQESSLGEKQLFMQEYLMNATKYKSASNVDADYLKIQSSKDLAKYQIGENVYVSDMSFAPFKNDWTSDTSSTPEFKEYKDMFIQTPATIGAYNLLYFYGIENPTDTFTISTTVFPIVEAEDILIVHNKTTEYYGFYKPNTGLTAWELITTPIPAESYLLPTTTDLVRNKTYFDLRTERRFKWNSLTTLGLFEEVL